MRIFRVAWLIVFLIPLTWWADRGCSVAGVDPLYHAAVWIHERLGWCIAIVAAASAATVLGKIAIARRRFSRLLSLAKPLPARVSRAFTQAARELAVPLPRIAYIVVDERIATTVVGPVIVISRGFVEMLSNDDLVLVARHELVHAARRDGTVGIVWHLVFSALLLPGFEPLERWFHARRERRANVTASLLREDAYLELLARTARGMALCAGVGLGSDAAARKSDFWRVWLAPAAIVLLAVALPFSHAEFMHDRTFLLDHHC